MTDRGFGGDVDGDEHGGDGYGDVDGDGAGGAVGSTETPAAVGLLGALLLAFLAQLFVEARYGGDAVSLFAVQSDRLHWVWTWVTANFVHANALHVFLNAAFIYLFGRGIERLYGGSVLLVAFFVTGAVAVAVGAVLAAVNACGADVVGWSAACRVSAGGSSAALSGLVGFLTRLRPRTDLYVLPSPSAPSIPLWTWTVGFVAISLLGMYTAIDPLSALLGMPVGHAYHLAGVVVGLAFGTVWTPTPAWERAADGAIS